MSCRLRVHYGLRQGRSVVAAGGHVSGNESVMAYYKVRIEVWCDWNPAESDLGEIVENIAAGEAICTKREVLNVVGRPQDIEDDEAMSFFGGEEGDADQSQG